jgi:cytochrome o ubiquinol oxidase subunit III
MDSRAHSQPGHSTDDKGVFGFWVYLMSDCVLFASLFAAYAVLHNNTFGAPTARELFDQEFVLVETILLLASSFTVGLALLAVRAGEKVKALWLFALTLVLGLGFLGMELYEFNKLVHEGLGPSRSGFMSAFFTLVGTHGMHIASGSIAMIVLMVRLARQGITPRTTERLTNLSLFWHFLDIVWIFIFSIVYLLGAVS